MNLTDLRDVLDERSATYDVAARSHLTLAGVQRRLVIRRRRRMAATAAAVVVVLAAGAGTLAITRSSGRTAVAAPTVATVGGFPEYAQGAHVIAASPPLAAGAKTLRLSFTPATADLVFFDRCTDPGAKYAIAVNGHEMMSGDGCGSSYGINLTDSPTGVRIGRPNTVTVTFRGAPAPGFALAVGQKVPLDQYVFPTRPPVLTPLAVDDLDWTDPSLGVRTPALLRADPANPNRPVQATFTWGHDMHVVERAQTPGTLTISVEGVTLGRGDWWDYEQGTVDGGREDTWTSGRLPKPGARVTVTVTPERMTGDWAVAVQEGNP